MKLLYILVTFCVYLVPTLSPIVARAEVPRDCALQIAEQIVQTVNNTVKFRSRGQLQGIVGLVESRCGAGSLSTADLSAIFQRVVGAPMDAYFAGIDQDTQLRSSGGHIQITICNGECKAPEISKSIKDAMGPGFQWAQLMNDDVAKIIQCVGDDACDISTLVFYLEGTEYHFVDQGIAVASCARAKKCDPEAFKWTFEKTKYHFVEQAQRYSECVASKECDQATFKWTFEKQEFHFFDDAIKISRLVASRQCDSQIFRRVYEGNNFHFIDDAIRASRLDR